MNKYKEYVFNKIYKDNHTYHNVRKVFWEFSIWKYFSELVLKILKHE